MKCGNVNIQYIFCFSVPINLHLSSSWCGTVDIWVMYEIIYIILQVVLQCVLYYNNVSCITSFKVILWEGSFTMFPLLLNVQYKRH